MNNQYGGIKEAGHVVGENILKLNTIHKARKATWGYYKKVKDSLSEQAQAQGGDYENFCFPINDAPKEVFDIVDDHGFKRFLYQQTGWKDFIFFDYYLFFKPPGAPQTPWHRDGDSLPIKGEAVTAWIPLTPIATGITYATGTGHTDPQKSMFENIKDLNTYLRLTNSKTNTVKRMKLGDILLHNKLIWHFGPENKSANYRLALSLSLVSGDAYGELNPKGYCLNSAKQLRYRAYKNNLKDFDKRQPLRYAMLSLLSLNDFKN